MRTLEEVLLDSTKSIMEREMAKSMTLYFHREASVKHFAEKMGIDESESELYYDFVIESQYEDEDE